MNPNEQQLQKMKTQPGFVAALDQSGGSTPKALAAYGIEEGSWSNDNEMFEIVHQMRARIITSPSFTGDRILGAILFEDTMDREIEGVPTAEYLWNVKKVVPFTKARERSLFGSKAVGLGDAARQGLSVPPGVALSGDLVEAVASGNDKAIEKLAKAIVGLPPPFAVRSSAVDEDGATASFAGQHLTLLNVHSAADVPGAVREVWWSANSDSAITYRQRVGLFDRPSVGVVVQTLLNPTAAGVMFTENPVTGADERVIEASWGLGEAVVAGLVVPDHFRLDRAGQVLERKAGRKSVAIRSLPSGGTFEQPVPFEQVNRLCLDDAQLAALGELALRCEKVYGPRRDIEWAFQDGKL